MDRNCNECKTPMNSGFCINGGVEYYCDEKCLHKHFSPEEYNDLHDNGNGDSYWTTWEDEN